MWDALLHSPPQCLTLHTTHCLSFVDPNYLQTSCADLTSKFPVIAGSGAQYVLVTEMDGYIHAEAMTSRHLSACIASFTRTIDFFTSLGRPPFFLRLDNETSLPLDKFIQKQKIQIQYCPPGIHRSNRAERSIQTFKNHAIATFYAAAKDFPLTLWDKLLPQIELCLNHLHPYKPNPAVSAYAVRTYVLGTTFLVDRPTTVYIL